MQMDKQNTTIDSVRLEKLHSLLIHKIEEEWLKKWQSHGKTFQGVDKLPSLNAFLEDLLDDVEKTIKLKLGLKATAEILISKDSLRRFIQKLQTSAKFKTRQTIALYIGYEGWDDFLEKNETSITEIIKSVNSAEAPKDVVLDNSSSDNSITEIIESPPMFLKQSTRRTRLILLSLLFLIGLIIGSIVIYYFNQKNSNNIVFRLISSQKNSFPTVIKVEYDIGQFDPKTTRIIQHNEPFDWYLKNDTRIYNLDNGLGEQKKGERIIYCDKPGLHHIDLVANEKIIAQIDVPVRSQDWFGIAYAQEKRGNKEFFFTNKADWEALCSKKQKKQLSLPADYLKDNFLDSRYRADFFYSGNIDIDVDEMCMEVDFTSAKESESFDCKYFQMGFIDSKGKFSFIYSPISTCSTEGAISIGSLHENDSIPFPNPLKDIMNFDPRKHEHKAKFSFKNSRVSVILDDSVRFEKGYNVNMGTLEVFYISFNSNSKINHFKVSSTTTFKTIYEESFD